PRSASSSARTSMRSAVSETAPTAASTSCSPRSRRPLSRSAMRAGAATLPAPLALRAVDDPLDGLDRHQLGRGRSRRGGLRFVERSLGSVRRLRLDRLATCELGLALLPDREQR